MRLVKFIYDDRDSSSQGFFVREYKDGEETTEWAMSQDFGRDTDIIDLIEAANISTANTTFEKYTSVSHSAPSQTY